MTITYSRKVHSVQMFGIFWRMLFRWKGSVYKFIWPELILYSITYGTLSITYRYAMGSSQRIIFEQTVMYCREYLNSVPVTFVLGFYVSLVVKRWWDQYQKLPWPDSLAILVSSSIQGRDVKTRMMRRTIVRYANLSFALALSKISPDMLERFPTFDKFIEEGLLLENEKDMLDDANTEADGSVYWVPLTWAISLVDSARRDNHIKSDIAHGKVVKQIMKFRGSCGGLLGYDKISIPLVYTQVVTLAVYSYLLTTLMGRQFINPENLQNTCKSAIDLYFPIFSYFQFIFYLGWLKVAESLANPFGKDDEDFDVLSLLDRDIKISYLIVDKMLDIHPKLQEDSHWNDVFYRQALIKPKKPFCRMATQEELEVLAEDVNRSNQEAV